MALARARRDAGMNYWPGFVDALATLVLGIIFLLSVFVVVQFYLTQEVTGKDTALSRLNAQIMQLTELLSHGEDRQDQPRGDSLRNCARALRPPKASATASAGSMKASAAARATRRPRPPSCPRNWTLEKKMTARTLAQLEVLNQQIAALRRQLAALEGALDAAEKKDKDSQTRIADLGQRLNVALAQRVQELSRYRSDFFGRLRVDPRQPPRHPHRRRPLRVPVGIVLRRRPGRAQAGRPRRARQDRERAPGARAARFPATFPG